MGADPERLAEDFGKAIEAYERKLVKGETPFDRFLSTEVGSLEPEVLRGAAVFVGAGQCARCHLGPLLTDQQLHDFGSGGVRTPPLRTAAPTPPYGHLGEWPTLGVAITAHAATPLTPQELTELEAFLRVIGDGVRPPLPWVCLLYTSRCV